MIANTATFFAGSLPVLVRKKVSLSGFELASELVGGIVTKKRAYESNIGPVSVIAKTCFVCQFHQRPTQHS